MLKEAVVRGLSLVFIRYHEVDVMGIRSHRIAEPHLCKNTLYLSTMLREMPCVKERVVHYSGEFQAEVAPVLMYKLKKGSWFGFAEVDVEIPGRLRPKFEEMCPFFYNKKGPGEAVPKHMANYLTRTSRNRGDGKKLVGALSAEGLLVYAPLLLWYVNHGAVVTKVYSGAGDGGTADSRHG